MDPHDPKVEQMLNHIDERLCRSIRNHPAIVNLTAYRIRSLPPDRREAFDKMMAGAFKGDPPPAWEEVMSDGLSEAKTLAKFGVTVEPQKLDHNDIIAPTPAPTRTEPPTDPPTTPPDAQRVKPAEERQKEQSPGVQSPTPPTNSPPSRSRIHQTNTLPPKAKEKDRGIER